MSPKRVVPIALKAMHRAKVVQSSESVLSTRLLIAFVDMDLFFKNSAKDSLFSLTYTLAMKRKGRSLATKPHCLSQV
jgi:hypothetical protein